ncbi:MAG: Xaa-Pro peptidase family protein [Thermoplasmataceae archaeon]
MSVYFQKSVYASRIAKIQKIMEQQGIASMVIPPGSDFFYFTGFETESMERLTLLVITADRAALICPSLMKEQAEQSTWVDEIEAWTDDQNPYALLGSYLPVGKCAIGGTLPYSMLGNLRSAIRGDDILADAFTVPLRTVKDQYELQTISEAVRKSEAALVDTLPEISAGVTETDIARILDSKMVEHGLQGPAFQTIVSAGANSAMPHHTPDSTPVKPGDMLVIDFGGRHKGYASDITRTFFMGKPDAEFERIYALVRKANEESRNTAGHESTYESLDAAARSVIESGGYGRYFIHRLGHGLGISVHEDPYVVSGNQQRLIMNSVFTIEPGIYITGKGGVRIEDTNYFDGSRCIAFNALSREMQTLP